jgi:hypothetical protein
MQSRTINDLLKSTFHVKRLERLMKINNNVSFDKMMEISKTHNLYDLVSMMEHLDILEKVKRNFNTKEKLDQVLKLVSESLYSIPTTLDNLEKLYSDMSKLKRLEKLTGLKLTDYLLLQSASSDTPAVPQPVVVPSVVPQPQSQPQPQPQQPQPQPQQQSAFTFTAFASSQSQVPQPQPPHQHQSVPQVHERPDNLSTEGRGFASAEGRGFASAEGRGFASAEERPAKRRC